MTTPTNKDQFFQHDYNPTTDPKLAAMVSDHGDWGYGLWWRIIEMLHRESDHALLLKDYVFSSLCQHKATRVQQVQVFVNDCITKYELFISDGVKFWSLRVNRNIQVRQEIKEKRSKAGKASAESRSVEHVLGRVKQKPTKESKVKESKVKEKKIELFSVFWEAYGKKFDRKKALDKWMSIELDLMPHIIEQAGRCAANTSDVQFQKLPTTWLNGACWEDEYPIPKGADKCVAGFEIDRVKYPNWDAEYPFEEGNIYRFNNNQPLRTWEQIRQVA